jgi:LacI family transcriptional regulator
MRPTIKQISKLANVSEGTVDRVINNRGKVKPETKEKIEKIIRKLKYKPNLFARNLALDSSFSVSVIMPFGEQDGGYWQLLKKGIDKAADNLQHFGLKINIYMYDKFLKESFVDVLKKALQEKFDSIILVPIYLEEAKIFLNKLPKDIPYVLIDTDIPGSNCLSSIHQNSYHGGAVAAQLMSMVVQIPSSISLVRFSPDTIHINERLRGFKDYFTNRKDVKLINTNIPEKYSKAEINKIFRKLYDENTNLKGIFVSNSHTYEVAKYIENINADKKIYLIGFDLVQDNLKYMRKDIIDFLISQNPEQQGYAGVYSLYRHLILREKVNKEITIPIEVVTKENIQFHDSESVIKNHEFNLQY